MADSAEQFDDELLSAYVDGELTDDQRLRVEEHLRAHPEAAALVEEFRRLAVAVRAAGQARLPRDLRADVLAGVARADADHDPAVISLERRRERWAARRRGLVWSAIAIAAAVALTLTQPPEQDERDLARRQENSGAPTEGGVAVLADAERPSRAHLDAPALSAPAAAPIAQDQAEERNVEDAPPAPAAQSAADTLAERGLAEQRRSDPAGMAASGRPSAPAGEIERLDRMAGAPGQAGGAAGTLAASSGSESSEARVRAFDAVKPAADAPGSSSAPPRPAASAVVGAAAAKLPVIELAFVHSDGAARFQQLLAAARLATAAEQAQPRPADGAETAKEAAEIRVEATLDQIDRLLAQCRAENLLVPREGADDRWASMRAEAKRDDGAALKKESPVATSAGSRDESGELADLRRHVAAEQPASEIASRRGRQGESGPSARVQVLFRLTSPAAPPAAPPAQPAAASQP